MTQNMNIALGANFDLLKTNLSAMFEKDDKGSKILLLPTKINSPNSVTLDEMITDFKKAFGMNDNDSKQIEEQLNAAKKEGSAVDIGKITFQLQSAFLYKDMPKQGSGNEETEYAFAISVNMAEALPDLGFVKLNNLFIAIWNTEREAVLRQIGTGNITKMLETLNA